MLLFLKDVIIFLSTNVGGNESQQQKEYFVMNTFRTQLAAVVSGVAFFAFSPANAQVIKAASPTASVAAAADFSVVVGKICRGYYNQAEGGTGSLERPESAFKTTSVDKSGAFTLLAIKAAPGASRGWDTASGNNYWKQGDVQFKVQPDGSWYFPNPAPNTYSKYYLTYVGQDAVGDALFTVRYEHGGGTAVGKAVCRSK
ncbi:hypothetical protein A2419_00800 [Candidatus Adlerbacteria bacterium RIFOXYC1_FULL_48_26]|uniref:Uncharacterized protein n=1 Tax=Candidatus Adlerbacteria bacterium RIFOXYC1_FULL_48_26 TaxID=1797247 RepID=A0A1F4Y262_9BACT|nr:MAG: hypothetical protein A2419_00800 [Candidatus Adlerbacteria bacterium RIFOXYC1_FULL_48_26]